MDLSTMRAKLEDGRYPDRFAFEADFRLIIRNAKTYNEDGSEMFTLAEDFEVSCLCPPILPLRKY